MPWIIAQSISLVKYKFYGNETYWLQFAGCYGKPANDSFRFIENVFFVQTLVEVGTKVMASKMLFNGFFIETHQKLSLKTVSGLIIAFRSSLILSIFLSTLHLEWKMITAFLFLFTSEFKAKQKKSILKFTLGGQKYLTFFFFFFLKKKVA